MARLVVEVGIPLSEDTHWNFAGRHKDSLVDRPGRSLLGGLLVYVDEGDHNLVVQNTVALFGQGIYRILRKRAESRDTLGSISFLELAIHV
jgi:hypothetical protein